jgi:hypothetical protein
MYLSWKMRVTRSLPTPSIRVLPSVPKTFKVASRYKHHSAVKNRPKFRFWKYWLASMTIAIIDKTIISARVLT